MPIKKLKLEKLNITSGTDVRNEISESTVSEYAEAALKKAKFPPLIVFETATDGLIIADGFHRYFAFERQGIKEYDCDVRKGTRADAIKFALGCNVSHGLRRTNKDKRCAVLIALKEFPKTTNRQISEICAVSHAMVNEIRAEFDAETEREKIAQKTTEVETASTSADETPAKVPDSPPPRRVGKSGKEYKVPARPAVEKEPVKNKTMDATGLEVPEEIIPYWDSTFAESQRLLNFISEVRTRLKRAQDTHEPMFSEVDHTDCIAKLDQVYADIKRAKPYAVCNKCNGLPEGGANHFVKTGNAERCAQCGGRGFVSEFFWKHHVDSDTKKITGRK